MVRRGQGRERRECLVSVYPAEHRGWPVRTDRTQPPRRTFPSPRRCRGAGPRLQFLPHRGGARCVRGQPFPRRDDRPPERPLGPDVQIVRRRIVSWSRDATQSLDRTLHDLIWRRSPEACHPPIVLPRRNGRPIVAYPSRLARAVREGFALVQGFLVFVDLEARSATLAADLVRVFGLTAAEARLADRLL